MLNSPNRAPHLTSLIAGLTLGTIGGLLAVTTHPSITKFKRSLNRHSQVAEQLRQSEKKYRSAMDNIQEVVFQTDETGRFTFLNAAWTEITGYSVEETLGRDFFSFILPEDRRRNAELFSPLLERQASYCRHTLRYLTKNGDWCWIELLARLTLEEDNTVTGISGTLSDLSERKKAQEKLQESEERYRILIEALAEGIVLQDGDGRILACNASAEQIMGLSAEQIMGRNSVDPRWKAIHEDGSDFPGETHPVSVSLKTGQPQSNIIMGVQKPDDTLVWLSINSRALFRPGQAKPYAAVASFFDVTKRRQFETALLQSEARTRALLSAIPDTMLCIKRDGEVVDFKLAAYPHPQIYSQAQEIIGKNLTEVLPPEVARQYFNSIEQVLHSGESQLFEYQLLIKGKLHDREARLVLNQEAEVLAIVRDITERKEIERIKSEFISTVSHELRTPLTSIRGALGLLAGGVAGELNPATRHMVDIANKNCERLIRLINDILDIEKIESGKILLKLQPLELTPLVEQVLEVNRNYGEQFEVTFELTECPPTAKIYADADRTIQVLTNLLSNAAKFSHQGGNVEIAVSRQGHMLRLAVADHGTGIPEEFQSRIFQKFAQADSSDTRQKGGTGLGLSISKAIAEKLGGQLSFETTPGNGTTFYFDLPEWIEQPPPEQVTVSSLSTTRVLVCEDDRDVATLLSMMLREHGFQIDLAHNAAQAKQLLTEHEYAAMTLDLMLPGQDGLSLLRELRQSEKTHSLPLIVVSAKAEQGQHELRGNALTVVDWIDKPINQSRLVAAVKQAVQVVPNTASTNFPHILHVEDDPDISKVVAVILQRVAVISRAGSLREARQKLQQETFDLILLDLGLPDGSGLELLPLLKNPLRPATPVVLFSAQFIERESARELDAVLVKSSTSNQELLNIIETLIQRQS